jgi:hypothetical protein
MILIAEEGDAAAHLPSGLPAAIELFKSSDHAKR